MAASKDVSEDLSERNFKCCVKQKVKIAVCIHCGNVFHRSCMERKNYIIIDDSRVICCEVSKQDSNSDQDSIGNTHTQGNTENLIQKLQCENQLLKKIIKEKDEKYDLLIENKHLLEDKIEYLTSSDKKQRDNKNFENTKKKCKQ